MLTGLVRSAFGVAMCLLTACSTPTNRAVDLPKVAPPGAQLVFQTRLGGGSNDLGGGTLLVYASDRPFRDIVQHYRAHYSSAGVLVSEGEGRAIFDTPDNGLCFIVDRWGSGVTYPQARGLMTEPERKAADAAPGSFLIVSDDVCSDG